jgi:arylsulfatase A-like enzyme/Flp pilus assembly protein TadD
MNPRLALVLTVCTLLPLAFCFSSHRGAGIPLPNVILITVDTLRADHLGCYGDSDIETPVIDALARQGVVFGRAVSQVPLTAPSHAALLTGTYPFWNGFQSWSDTGLRPDVPTLAEIFQAHGYTTAAFVSAFVLDSMWGLRRGFDLYDDWFRTQDYQAMQNYDVERRGGETIDHVLNWLRSLPRQPFFLWVHLYDPHLPYNPPEPFKTKYRSHLYDGEIAYDDQQLGRLFEFLKAQSLYSSSLIVLTSDHGEGLGEHQERDHGYFIYNSTVHVPLIIKLPSDHPPGRRSVSQVVNVVDIAPTLARLSGIPDAATRSFQGQNLVSLIEKGGESPARYGLSESIRPQDLLNAHRLLGVQTVRYAYIQAARDELYDLQWDPGEKRNILRENPVLAESLRQAARDLRTRFQPPADAAPQRGSLSPEAVEKLRSLGYVSVSRAPNNNGENPQAADPKDEIGAYNQLLRATTLAQLGRYQESNQLLRGLASTHPQVYIVAFMQGQNSLALGQPEEAQAHLRRALELNPISTQAAISLGRASVAIGDKAGAAKAYELALQLNPQDFLTQLALAKAYWGLGRLPEAANLQGQVLKSHPRFAQAYAEYGETLVQMQRLQDAIPAMQKSLNLGYRDAFLYNLLGNAFAALGNNPDARNAYEEAIQTDARYVKPYANLAVLWDRLGDHNKARMYFEETCRRSAAVCRQLAPRFK